MLRSGGNFDGTFREYAVAYTDFVTPIPEGLESAEAAAFMCAVRRFFIFTFDILAEDGLLERQGFTVYSALRQSETHVGDWIAIPGAGGGLGHLGKGHLPFMIFQEHCCILSC